MKIEYHGVKGHSDLLRDPNTNSIVNSNNSDYEKYVARRNAQVMESQKTENIEEDLANLKSEMNEIKSLLQELVSNVH
jgi:chemotaxis methyl-accepting protein methylase